MTMKYIATAMVVFEFSIEGCKKRFFFIKKLQKNSQHSVWPECESFEYIYMY